MSSATRHRYVFDLDGTIAAIDHRRPALAGPRPDWHSFNKASLFDEPVAAVVQVMRALTPDYSIWIVSGRSDAVELETRGWLTKYQVPYDHLLMRSARDQQPDHALKRAWAQQYDFVNTVHAVFDDRDSVVAMWRELGLPCFQVAPGDF